MKLPSPDELIEKAVEELRGQNIAVDDRWYGHVPIPYRVGNKNGFHPGISCRVVAIDNDEVTLECQGDLGKVPLQEVVDVGAVMDRTIQFRDQQLMERLSSQVDSNTGIMVLDLDKIKKGEDPLVGLKMPRNIRGRTSALWSDKRG